jgi:predicted Zn finger-like uncharacterized protein
MNVSCPACKTRYSVDDSRVPPTGVTIRCPKCGHSFVAKRPDAAPRDSSAVALPGSVARQTPAPRGGSAVALPGSVARAAPPPSAPSMPAAPRPAPSGGMNIPAPTTDPGLDLGLDEDLLPPASAPAAPPSAPPRPAAAPAPARSQNALGDSGMLDFIDDTRSRASVKPGGPSQSELKVRRRNGRVEGPYGIGRIATMLRNKELQGTEDISEDGVAWKAMTSEPQLNQVINELHEDDQMSFGNVDLGGVSSGGGDLDLGLDRGLPPSRPPVGPSPGAYASAGPSVSGAGRTGASLEDMMGDLESDLAGFDPDAGAPPRASADQALMVPGAGELEVGEIPELPPFWKTYKRPILIFTAVMGLVLAGVFTQLFTPYGAFGVPALVATLFEEPPPPPPVKPPPPPPKVADPKELASLINEHCFECFRSVFATIAAAGPGLPDNMLAMAKARGFATLAYGKEAFPMEELLAAAEALNTVDLSKAMGGNAAAANQEILKARSALEILSGAADQSEPQLAAVLEQRPDDRELALLLGLARKAQNKPVEALQALDKALVTEPTYAPALHAIGEIVLAQGGENAQADAAVWFQKAIDAVPAHARSGLEAAKLYAALHQSGPQRRVMTQVAQVAERGLPPQDRARHLYETALFYDRVERLTEGAQFAAEAARLEPGNGTYVALAAAAAAVKGSSLEALNLLSPVLQRDPADVEALLARARVYIDTDDIAKGFIDLEAAKVAAPRDHRVPLWEARFNAKLGKLNDARTALTRAIKLAGDNPDPNIMLGRIDLSLGDVDAALGNAEAATKAAPSSAEAHALLGDVFVRRGQLDKARETFAKALALDDESVGARIGYANALRDEADKADNPERSPELAQAIPLYLAALAAQPKNPQVLFEYGRALELQGDLPAALSLYRDAAALDEKDPRPHLKMVAAYLEQGELTDAKTSLERGRTIEMASGTKSGEVRFWEARVAAEDGRIHDAVASLRLAVELEPRNALYHFWLGRVLEKNNSLYEAITYYERATQLNSRLGEAYRALGWTALERHQFDKARDAFERYKESAPHDRSIWVDIGESYTRQNKDEEAMTAFRTAIKYLPGNGQALLQIGNILGRQGKEKEAVEYFQRAVKAQPDLGAAWCQLGIALARKDLSADAKRALTKCVQDTHAPDDMRATADEILSSR